MLYSKQSGGDAVKRVISLLLVFCLLGGAFFVRALSQNEIRVVIGEDLSEENIAVVYNDFQLERGSVPELSLSNAEEYALLGSYVDSSVIGSAACSCVCLSLLPEGSGIKIRRHNISWCTDEMYEGALRTAGIENVEVIISAPFEVSGTAALAGIFKAYEDISNTPLTQKAKDLSVQELLVTGELSEEIGSFDASLMVESLKGSLAYTETLNDQELSQRIEQVAGDYHIKLNETQISQLLMLCRQLEKLDELKLEEKVQSIKETVESLQELKKKAGELQEKTKGWREKIHNAFQEIKVVYDDASSWYERNRGKFQELWIDIQALFSAEESEVETPPIPESSPAPVA